MTEREPKFRIGDLVKLRSGGPVLTIDNLRNEIEPASKTGKLYDAVWFVDGIVHRESFFADQLESIDRAEPPAPSPPVSHDTIDAIAIYIREVMWGGISPPGRNVYRAPWSEIPDDNKASWRRAAAAALAALPLGGVSR